MNGQLGGCGKESQEELAQQSRRRHSEPALDNHLAFFSPRPSSLLFPAQCLLFSPLGLGRGSLRAAPSRDVSPMPASQIYGEPSGNAACGHDVPVTVSMSCQSVPRQALAVVQQIPTVGGPVSEASIRWAVSLSLPCLALFPRPPSSRGITMDFINQFTGGGEPIKAEPPQQPGGGALKTSLLSKFNNAAGGGAKGEHDEGALAALLARGTLLIAD